MTLSIRAKITFLTTSVLALILVAFGATLERVGEETLTASIDNELKTRALGIARGHRLFIERTQQPGFPGGTPKDFRPLPSDPLRTLGPRLFFAKGQPNLTPFGDMQAYDPVGLTRAWAGEVTYRTTTISGEPVRVISLPVRTGKEITLVIQEPYPLGDFQRSFASVRKTQFILLPVALVGAGLVSLFLVHRLLAPIRMIVQKTSEIDSPNLDNQLPVYGNDEFSNLSRTINGMLERLRDSFKAQEESLDRQRRFTADASHELRTPLATIAANASIISVPTKDQESLQAIQTASNRMANLISGLLHLAKAEAHVAFEGEDPIDSSEVIRSAVSSLPAPSRTKVTVTGPSFEVKGSADSLRRAILNVLENSLRHSGTNSVEIKTSKVGEKAVIQISDRGVGIEAQHIPFLFDRFYRVDASRNSDTGGSGLGLAIVKSVVEAHHGTVSVNSVPHVLTTFQIELPIH
jgi:signal transduction histidine kinase